MKSSIMIGLERAFGAIRCVVCRRGFARRLLHFDMSDEAGQSGELHVLYREYAGGGSVLYGKYCHDQVRGGGGDGEVGRSVCLRARPRAGRCIKCLRRHRLDCNVTNCEQRTHD